MKPHPVVALAMVIGVGSGAMAQDRTPVQDAKLLLIAAVVVIGGILTIPFWWATSPMRSRSGSRARHRSTST